MAVGVLVLADATGQIAGIDETKPGFVPDLGGGTIAATEGKDVTLPAGTILRVRLDTPPNIR